MQISSASDELLPRVVPAQLSPVDAAFCRRVLARGSKSFAAASLALPARVREPAAAIYAFCRVADDLIDEHGATFESIVALRRRLDGIYAGRPVDSPVDRAFAAVILHHPIPKPVPRALLEGLAWDAQCRQYETLDELMEYCARVASTVGVMMTVLMGHHEEAVLARAADLGLAMQLTNIARDVGEDARRGRIYLPLEWLRGAGIDPRMLVREPSYSPDLARVVERLLRVAEIYYRRADHGIGMLPRDCRVAIRAARLIYADIGNEIARRGFDSVNVRAHTGRLRKLWLITRSIGAWFWRARHIQEPAHPATHSLVACTATRGSP